MWDPGQRRLTTFFFIYEAIKITRHLMERNVIFSYHHFVTRAVKKELLLKKTPIHLTNL